MSDEISLSGTISAALLIVASLFGAHSAFADEHPDARNTAIDANPMRLDPAGQGVFVTGSAETLTHLEWRASVVGHYLTRPLVIEPEGDNVPTAADPSERPLVEQRQQLDVSAAIGLFDRAEVGFVVPVTLSQDAQYPGFGLGSVASSGLGNAEVYGLVNILSQKHTPLGLAVGAPVRFPTQSGNGYFGHDGFSVAPQLRLTRRFGPVKLAASGDVLFQPESSLNTAVDGNRVRWKSGVMVEPTEQWGVGAEFVGSTPLDAPEARYSTRGEVLVGGRIRPLRQLDIQFNVGRSVISGIGASAFRAMLGVSFHHGRPAPPLDELSQCERAERGQAPEISPEECPDQDFDGDSIANASDECAAEVEDADGFQDNDGCPDPDNDGDAIADTEDTCPNATEDIDGFEDQEGCPDLDNDRDGIADADDQCSTETEDFDGFRDGDGCPDPDNDNDGLADIDDECPDDAGEAENSGCSSQEAPEAKVTKKKIEISEKIFFVSDRAIIRRRSYDVLEKVGEALGENPGIQKVEIRGYADQRGKSKYNYHLSWERAKVVRQYLIDNADIDPSRLEAAGYGELTSENSAGTETESPDSEEDWAKARRVDFKITERAGP